MVLKDSSFIESTTNLVSGYYENNDIEGLKGLIKTFKKTFSEDPSALIPHFEQPNSLSVGFFNSISSVLKGETEQPNHLFVGFLTSVYYELTGIMKYILDENYGGLGVTINQPIIDLTFSRNQLHFATLKGKALQYSKNSGNALKGSMNSEEALQGSTNSGEALQGSTNSGEALEHSKNSAKALSWSENSGSALYKSINSGDTLTLSDNSGNALQHSKNSGWALFRSTNRGSALQNSKNSGNALQKSKNSEMALQGSTNSERALEDASIPIHSKNKIELIMKRGTEETITWVGKEALRGTLQIAEAYGGEVSLTPKTDELITPPEVEKNIVRRLIDYVRSLF
jgi:hypothetical protein